MSSYVARHHEFTLASYFVLERQPGERHEFDDGQVHVMAAGPPRHNHLAGRIYALLAARLDGGPCAPLPVGPADRHR